MNIIIGGVGGQGLVLSTKIISEAAFLAGFDVKTNDVIGLSQRVGRIWGSVKYADKVHSPNITEGQADILIGFEPLEAQRYAHMLKPEGGIIIVNTFEMAPMIVQQGKEHYPENVLEKLKEYGAVFALNATEKAAALGNVAVVNILMLGIAAARMDIDKEIWRKAIENNVPERFREMNENAFEIGFGYAIQGSDFL